MTSSSPRLAAAGTQVPASVLALARTAVQRHFHEGDPWPGHNVDPLRCQICNDAADVASRVAYAAGRESMMPKPKPPIVYVKPRGICSVCGTERALNIEGNLHGHDAPRARRRDGFGYPRNCPGSRKPPKAVP